MATKSEIFRTAWAVARSGAKQFGGSPRDYFVEALRMTYAHLREQAANAHKPAALTTAEKVLRLADLLDLTVKRNTFAWRFVADNAARVAKYGASTRFSAKQAAIIDDLHARF